MDCKLIENPLGDGRSTYHCARCGRPFVAKSGFAHARRMCRAAPQPLGPGGHLVLLIRELALHPDNDCGCLEKAGQMDQWGVAGCQEHRAEIVGWLKEAFAKVDWPTTIAAYRELRKADWFSHFRPFESIVDESIRRAKENTPPASQ